MTEILFSPGLPSPLGATKLSNHCYRFALFSSQANQVVLVLADEYAHTHEIVLSSQDNRTGSVWHIDVEGISDDWSYAFRIDGLNSHTAKFDFLRYVADPYAKNIHSPQLFLSDKTPHDYLFGYLKEEKFDWDGDRCLNLPKEEMIIYEMHVRSFTWDPSSQSYYPGTFLGIIEKIPYLKKLGITALELLPIFEFDETNNPFHSPNTRLCNYWGYSSIHFFSPCRRYAYAPDPCAPIREFKSLVQALHSQNIEIILDVVFNHTDTDTCSLPWIDLSSYYLLNDQGQFTNYSGCGNTLNTNCIPTAQWILSVLRYWVEEMHVDGFRFDLASVFSRDTQGTPVPLSPILDLLSNDPILAHTKLIAEPWDAAGLYQLGYFPTLNKRWCEWNGSYRDTVKDFLNGNTQRIGEFASRISGSQDIYPQGSPLNSVNYICSHDGFTLRDSVSHVHKHNEENGEHNADGTNENYSHNFGEEGESHNPDILTLRKRQMRNFFLTLFLSQGIPMFQAGDEYGHTAGGNNNRWALDTKANHFLWDELEKEQDMVNFVQQAITFRKVYKELFSSKFLTEEKIRWIDANAQPIQWSPHHFLAYERQEDTVSLFVAFHTGKEEITITLPQPRNGFLPYQHVVDTQNGFVTQEAPEKVTLHAHTIYVAISHQLISSASSCQDSITTKSACS